VARPSFQCSIELPEGVDKDKITAEDHNGVLGSDAAISAAALPRKIEVKSLRSAKRGVQLQLNLITINFRQGDCP
jgi:hypothetical protein